MKPGNRERAVTLIEALWYMATFGFVMSCLAIILHHSSRTVKYSNRAANFLRETQITFARLGSDIREAEYVPEEAGEFSLSGKTLILRLGAQEEDGYQYVVYTRGDDHENPVERVSWEEGKEKKVSRLFPSLKGIDFAYEGDGRPSLVMVTLTGDGKFLGTKKDRKVSQCFSLRNPEEGEK